MFQSEPGDSSIMLESEDIGDPGYLAAMQRLDALKAKPADQLTAEEKKEKLCASDLRYHRCHNIAWGVKNICSSRLE
jgi:hypothetical protein